MSTHEAAVRAAARDNADWCAAMCRAHGVSSEAHPEAWVAASRTPLFYPDAVTLVPGVDPARLLDRIDTSTPGASVKDSFADLDLAPAGFGVLFEAQWLHRRPGPPASSTALSWSLVDTPADLRAWALAWDDGAGQADLFRPGLLADPPVALVAGRRDDLVVAGAVLTHGGEVVGVSNVFERLGDPDAAWTLALDAVSALFPDRPVVGYEHGDDLQQALRHGFEPVGPLRVWTDVS